MLRARFFVLSIGLLICLFLFYLYYILFVSAFRLEEQRALYGANDDISYMQRRLDDIIESQTIDDYLYVVQPLEFDLHLRKQLVSAERSMSIDSIRSAYLYLLKRKPTWPYYYSALAQVEMIDSKVDKDSLARAVLYGRYEVNVVKSLAEILFYTWNDVDLSMRNMLLKVLVDQNSVVVSSIVAISAKFAKIYVYCDFIYNEKHVEYAACKDQYWQPLKY